MFKVLKLSPTVDDELQALQQQWEVEQVINLGTDDGFIHYLLVQYDVLPPAQNPVSGSVTPQDQAKKPTKVK